MIQMADVDPRPGFPSDSLKKSTADAAKTAVRRDMCKDLKTGRPPQPLHMCDQRRSSPHQPWTSSVVVSRKPGRGSTSAI